jgi:CDP-glucose 4,6-dehydratase
MEKLVDGLFGNVYKNKKVLITGHTGFKGSWLSLWLHELGAEVYGISNKFVNDKHFKQINIKIKDYEVDVRDYFTLEKIIKDITPDIIFHLAAQSIVSKSYCDPLEAWTTNMLGTVNLLNIIKENNYTKNIVIITSDKCYENQEKLKGYSEKDKLGGYDPYSSSKAAVELACNSYRSSYFNNLNISLSTARAGNVIGGGDWSQDRLIPDLMRSTHSVPVEIRYPESIRPWQHVLDSLSGYLLLGQKNFQNNLKYSEAWNFGPNTDKYLSVIKIAEIIKEKIPRINYKMKEDKISQHETKILLLNSGKAKSRLKWKPIWNIDESINETINWYKNFYENDICISRTQLINYCNSAKLKKVIWAI